MANSCIWFDRANVVQEHMKRVFQNDVVVEMEPGRGARLGGIEGATLSDCIETLQNDINCNYEAGGFQLFHMIRVSDLFY